MKWCPKLDSKLYKKLAEIYRSSRPIILVLLMAAIIVFINSYPNVPSIAEETVDYRQKIKSRTDLNDTEKDELQIIVPTSPSLPNTIAPVVTPEEVNKIVTPKPKPEPEPKPGPDDDLNKTLIDTTPVSEEPSLQIKLLAGLLNVAPLIIIAAIGGFGIYLLFKYKKHFTLRSMFGSAIGLVAACAVIFFGFIALDFIDFLYEIDLDSDLALWGIIPFAIIIAFILSTSIISKRTTVFKRNIGLAVVGALMGSFLAAFLPFWIIFILLIGISLFDIYSVKFGPIKKIMDLEQNSKPKKVNKLIKPNIQNVKQVRTKKLYRNLDTTVEQSTKEVKETEKDSIIDVVEDVNYSSLKLTTKDNDVTTVNEGKNYADSMESTSSGDSSSTSKNSITPSTMKISKTPIQPTHAMIQKRSEQNTSQQKRSKPLIKAKSENDEEFDLMLMYDNPNWSLGLGDFVIYSLFTSVVLTYTMIYLPYYVFYTPTLGFVLPWLIFAFCVVGLMVGFFKTIKLLEKRDYLPGLPISIGMGFVVFMICIFILQLVNYLLYSEFAIIF
jgi:hypothetical protein